MQIERISENTLMISYAKQIDPAISDQLLGTLAVLQQQFGHLLIDAVPSYCSILLTIDVQQISLEECQNQIRQVLNQYDFQSLPQLDHEIEVPVYYGQEVALDADEVCEKTGLSWQQVIDLHNQQQYRVYAIGFAPGFAYLGHLDEKLSLERKATPRAHVPKGSVAIAGQQTAVYPKSSPGGWHIIGRTPISLVDFEQENLSLFHIGAQVRFKAISRQQYLDLGGQLDEEEKQ